MANGRDSGVERPVPSTIEGELDGQERSSGRRTRSDDGNTARAPVEPDACGGGARGGPVGFAELTGTAEGFDAASEAADRAALDGLQRDAAAYRVFKRDDTTVVVHPAILLNSVTEVGTPLAYQIDVEGILSDASVAEAEGFSAHNQASSSASAQTGNDTHTESGGTTQEDNCYDMDVSNSRVWMRSCWVVRYLGYNNSYYYYNIEQMTTARGKKSNERLIGVNARVRRHYGTTYAAPDPIDPASSVTHNCTQYPLSVTGGPFTFGTTIDFCEKNHVLWDDYSYSISWDGSVRDGEYRRVRYLLAQRRYRNSSWKYTFGASSWTRA